ncbi:transposase [Allobaculum mucilyticum]|nr:transposase [Allobaculum mucilyticum]UNT96637.1 transposase [Allobaculum mucilyticum]
MEDELLYSPEARSDSYYTDLFAHRMKEEQELSFKEAWASSCKNDGAEDVWLCIDGSNDDCQSQCVDLAEKGMSKSHTNNNVISFTYAVTVDGKPVSFEAYRGGLVDFKAMKVVITHLVEAGFHVKGVILDRGCCNSDVLHYLRDHQIPYIVMVKGCPSQCKEMWETYGSRIKMNVEYLVEDTCLFAAQQKVSLYHSCDWEDYVTLYFDYQNGSERITALLNNLYAARSKAPRQMERGKKSSWKESMKIFWLSTKQQRKTENQPEYGESPKGDQRKGLYSIVSSLPFTPHEIHSLYQARSAVEVQFRVMKTQLGYGTSRVQCSASLKAKFLVGFVAAVIRHELALAAAETGRSTNQMVQEADKLQMQKMNSSYVYTHTESERLKALSRSWELKTFSN